MADFYPVLARAVSRLADDGHQARQELYDHARTILVSQLRGRDSQISAYEIMREQAALETAIRQVETASHSAQSQSATGVRPHRLMPNRGVIANGSTQAMVDRSCLNEVVREPQQTMARGRSQGLPLAVHSDSGIEVSLAVRRAKLTSAIANKLHRNINTRNDPLFFKQAKTRSVLAHARKIGASDDSAFLRVMPLGIGLIVTMLALIALICFPVILMYNPRIVWLFEHLIDNPPMFVVIAITLSLFVLLFLPILGNRRKRSVIGFLRHLISM
jgi:hypothetical protein